MSKNNFNDFNLSQAMYESLAKMRFRQPTEVQRLAIEPALEGKDLLVQAPTGTGKTGAFGIPLVESISRDKVLQALVLCPTRELAIQTGKVLGQLAQCSKNINVATLYGGENIGRQLAALRRKPQIVVATPGRLLDHMKRKSLRFSGLHTLVLDEADRMLDMGFRDDLHTIVASIPAERQTFLFSATLSKEIQHLAAGYQDHPERIVVREKGGKSQSQIQQFFAETNEGGKLPMLKTLLDQEDCRLSLVFVNTKVKSMKLAKQLKGFGLRAECMHGGMRQVERDKIMRLYRSKKLDVLVATDVAARGIDVKDIDTVINYDFPLEQENYIHRIGRTGRATQKGIAYTFVCPSERHKMKAVARNAKIKIERVPQAILDMRKQNSGAADKKIA